MRRIFATLCVFVLFLAAAPVSGQTIGFKLGFSSSVMELDPNAPQHRLAELSAAGFIRFAFGDFNLQGEVMAVTKGSQDGLPAAAGFTDSELKLSYIEIPITAMYVISHGYFFGGPALALETDCVIDGRDFATDEHFSFDCDGINDVQDFFDHKTVDFGLTAGLGFQVKAGPGSVVFEGRHTWGLTDIDDSNLQSAKNRAFVFYVGYAIKIGEQ